MVEYITYQEEKYPIRVSYSTMKNFQNETGKSISKIGDDEDIALYETILFYALKSGAKATRVDMPFKKEDMEDVLDECFVEFIEKFPKFFPENDTAEPPENVKGKQTTPKKKS